MQETGIDPTGMTQDEARSLASKLNGNPQKIVALLYLVMLRLYDKASIAWCSG